VLSRLLKRTERISMTIAAIEGRTVVPAAYSEKPNPKDISPTGAEILAYVDKYLQYFAIWPNDATRHAVALWILHAHARKDDGTLIWQSSPRLWFQSLEPGSGKSWAMKVASRLCPLPKIFTEPSEPAVCQAVGKLHVTMFLDECDILFGAGGRKEAIRAVINDGYTPDGTWARVRNGGLDEVNTFGALALAGLEAMESDTNGKMTALLTRCIRIRMRRGPKDYFPPRYDKEAKAIAGKLTRMLAEWSSRVRDDMEEYVPAIPGIGNRFRELWEPLVTVADFAGGEWPQLAREAADRLTRAGDTPADSLEMASDVEDLMADWDGVKSDMESVDDVQMPESPDASEFCDGAQSDAKPLESPRRYGETANKLLACLEASDGPLDLAVLTGMVGAASGTVRVNLSRLHERGEVWSPASGKWAYKTRELRELEDRVKSDSQPDGEVITPAYV
jgi:hypothetical protein